VVDGRGAWRVVGAWEQLVGGLPDPADGDGIAVRRATLDDAATLLAWRNDPDTRVASREGKTVSLDTHRRWLEAALADDDRILLVGSDADGDVGTVRWDRRGDAAWEVSITVAPERRGAGTARQLLAAGERELESRVGRPLLCLAAVRTTNDASRRLFARSAYLPEAPADDDGFELFAKQLTAAG
jgi:ribosomal protein S18 acetylase RimI-like enzyme